MTDWILQQFREIVREEIRREKYGPRCPDCGAADLGWDMIDIDVMVGDDETTTIACYNCEYQGPPETFDPSNQGWLGETDG